MKLNTKKLKEIKGREGGPTLELNQNKRGFGRITHNSWNLQIFIFFTLYLTFYPFIGQVCMSQWTWSFQTVVP